MAAAHVVAPAALIGTTWTSERMGLDRMRTTAFIFFEILSVAPPWSAVRPANMTRPLWVRSCYGGVEREYKDSLEHSGVFVGEIVHLTRTVQIKILILVILNTGTTKDFFFSRGMSTVRFMEPKPGTKFYNLRNLPEFTETYRCSTHAVD